MAKYLIIDLANTFFRARHSAHKQSDFHDKLGFALHVTLSSINSAWRKQKADHVVVCLEGSSWRKEFYKPYKANRKVAYATLTEKEQEEEEKFWETFDNLKNYFINDTNCTVLQHADLEADDLIAGWIQTHPNDSHVIISSDTDFHQLLSENVSQYNGISDELHTLEGIFDRNGKRVIDNKTKEPKTIPNPEWILFKKCMRGDPTDNIFSAFPGVREKGSKNKIGLLEAFEDRNKKGFNWNNMMLNRWVDHDGIEHRVLDDYERNRTLVDLTAQPEPIKEKIIQTIKDNAISKQVPMVGAKFLKFCGKFELVKLSEYAESYCKFLSSEYMNVISEKIEV